MLAMTVGCVKTDDISAEQAGVMTLQLRNNELVATRATTPGVVNLNENLISTVQCFFSTDGATVLYATDVIEVNDTDGVVENLPLTIPADKMGTLFPNGAIKCNIYVVANAPEKITATTIATIKDTAISLAADGNQAQPTFVMDGSAEVTKANDNSISGTVNLTRAAAKILVTANINKKIVFTSVEGESVKTETWTPDMKSIKMTYHNSATKSKLSAEVEDASEYKNYAQQPKTKEDGTLDAAVFTYTVGADKYVATQAIPFYSYPRDWDDNATNKPYIELVIPWKRTTDTQYSTYTYQIPLDIDAKTLKRNNLYKLTVNVGILGSLTGNVELSPSYVVIDWGKGTINAELSRPKYLVVDQHHYVLNNETSLEIPFHSSDKCVIASYSCTQSHLVPSDDNPDNPTHNASADGSTNRQYSVNIEDGKIVVKHGLNNNLYDETDDANGVFDFTPYEFTLTIQHEGDPSFSETITITQYPAVHGMLQENLGGNENDGYVFVNGYVGTPDSSDKDADGTVQDFCNVRGYVSSSDDISSTSMTVVTVSSLSGTKYILGDPRSMEVDENLINGYGDNWNWMNAKALSGDSPRELTYYYPALSPDEFNDSTTPSHPTYNMVAPKFRISSGYAAIYQNNPTNRRYMKYMHGRCASYQEDGYPAGRWRLPTKAELEFINTLSEKGLLPDLFDSSIPYWTAHGYGQYSNGKFNMTHSDDRGSTSVSVRCVYDDWYWGSEPALKTDAEKKVFTWGDQPR